MSHFEADCSKTCGKIHLKCQKCIKNKHRFFSKKNLGRAPETRLNQQMVNFLARIFCLIFLLGRKFCLCSLLPCDIISSNETQLKLKAYRMGFLYITLYPNTMVCDIGQCMQYWVGVRYWAGRSSDLPITVTSYKHLTRCIVALLCASLLNYALKHSCCAF